MAGALLCVVLLPVMVVVVYLWMMEHLRLWMMEHLHVVVPKGAALQALTERKGLVVQQHISSRCTGRSILWSSFRGDFTST